MLRDLSPIHPELRTVARFLPSGGPTSRRRLRVFRTIMDGLARLQPGSPDVVRVGSIDLRVHRPAPASTPQPAILWIHGGGYVMGSAAAEDLVSRTWMERLGVVVASPAYRLAPEHPFPAAVEDCHDALVWLAAQDGVDETRVGIGGGSAGGGLAAALALLARERGVVDPAFQLLLYPMVDDRTVLRDDIDETGFRLWNNASNRLGWASYLGTEPGTDAVSGVAAPARHDDLSGLPPAWVGVGTLDLFHDEDLAYAAALRAAGVEVDEVVVPGAFHGFNLARRAAVVQEFEDSMHGAMADGLGVELRGR